MGTTLECIGDSTVGSQKVHNISGIIYDNHKTASLVCCATVTSYFHIEAPDMCTVALRKQAVRRQTQNPLVVWRHVTTRYCDLFSPDSPHLQKQSNRPLLSFI